MSKFLLLLVIPIAFAEISLTLPEKDTYNLGEKITPTISIKEDADYYGIFNLHISCDEYDLQYYTIPLNIEADTRTELNVPELPLSKSMIGECKLKSNFEETDGERIDSKISDNFFVKDDLNIIIDQALEAKPGEDFIILGEVKKQSNELLQEGEAKIIFKGKEDKIEIISGKFEYKIHLDENT